MYEYGSVDDECCSGEEPCPPKKTGQLILRCCRGYMEGLFRAVPLQSHVATYPLVRTLSCPARQVVGSQELAGAS